MSRDRDFPRCRKGGVPCTACLPAAGNPLLSCDKPGSAQPVCHNRPYLDPNLDWIGRDTMLRKAEENRLPGRLGVGSDDRTDSKASQRDVLWMREAIALATANVGVKGGPFGALIVRDGEVVARGQNEVLSTNDPTAHAEIVTIRRACSLLKSFSLAGCTLYSSCEPCPMCLAAMLWARVDRLVFGNTSEDAAAAGFSDAQYYAELSKPRPDRSLPSTNLLREEAAASFKAWNELNTGIVY